MKKALQITAFIILFPAWAYLFFADRIWMYMFPFIKNEWHQDLAKNHDKHWIALLGLYRVLMLLIFISIYKFLTYVF